MFRVGDSQDRVLHSPGCHKVADEGISLQSPDKLVVHDNPSESYTVSWEDHYSVPEEEQALKRLRR